MGKDKGTYELAEEIRRKKVIPERHQHFINQGIPDVAAMILATERGIGYGNLPDLNKLAKDYLDKFAKDYKPNPREGLSEGLLKIIDNAQTKDGHNLGYLYINLPEDINKPGLNQPFSYGLRIPIQGEFDLVKFLESKKALIADGIIIRYSLTKKEVIEFFGQATSKQEFEVISNKFRSLANMLYEELEKTGHIKPF
ncbi:MAG: hypothetical protein PHD81_04585 [Candidatus Nanoarchaeia archaeon]|nr:hypothetical protein [Candidatus Nanoarchaeia archaeon]MDD5588353.1 hypothetical protein [Candidatus Nanoarchaeia archaeon]